MELSENLTSFSSSSSSHSNKPAFSPLPVISPSTLPTSPTNSKLQHPSPISIQSFNQQQINDINDVNNSDKGKAKEGVNSVNMTTGIGFGKVEVSVGSGNNVHGSTNPNGVTSNTVMIPSAISPPTPVPSPQPNKRRIFQGLTPQPPINSSRPTLPGLGISSSANLPSWSSPLPSSPPSPTSRPLSSFLPTYLSLPLPARHSFLLSFITSIPPSDLSFLSSSLSPLLKRDFIKDLPPEVALRILRFVSEDEISLIRCAGVSRYWRRIVGDEENWRVMCERRGVRVEKKMWDRGGSLDSLEGLVGFGKESEDDEVEDENGMPSTQVSERNRSKPEEEEVDGEHQLITSTSANSNALLEPQPHSKTQRRSLSLTSSSSLASSGLSTSATSDAIQGAEESSNVDTESLRSERDRVGGSSDDEEAIEGMRSESSEDENDTEDEDGDDSDSDVGYGFGGVPLIEGARRRREDTVTAESRPGSRSRSTTIGSELRRPSSTPLPELIQLQTQDSTSGEDIPQKKKRRERDGRSKSASISGSTSASDGERTGNDNYLRSSSKKGSRKSIPSPSNSKPNSATLTSTSATFNSYRTHFKRAYLTESAWLRGPGRLITSEVSEEEGVVTTVCIDDEWIVLGMSNNLIHVFEWKTGRWYKSLRGHEGGVWCLTLVSGSGSEGGTEVKEKDKGKGKGRGEDRWQDEEAVEDDEDEDETKTMFRSGRTGELGARSGEKIERSSSSSATSSGFTIHPTNGLGMGMMGFPTSSSVPTSLASSMTNFSDPSRFPPSHSGPSSPSTITPHNPLGFTSGIPSLPSPPIRQSRRPVSFHSYTSDHPPWSARENGREREGGMGIGAGGPTGTDNYQSTVCGITKGWGQKGAVAVSSGCDREVRVWDVESGTCKHILRGHTSTIRCLKVLSGRPIAISGSRDSTVRVWDIETGVCLRVLLGHERSVRAMEVHGNKVVTASYDTTARLWDVDEGRCIWVFKGHFHQIYSVAFDGKMVATGSVDSTVRVWSAETGSCLAVLQGHTSLVGHVLFGPSALLTGGSDGRVIVFSLSTFETLHRICAHDNSVTSLQFDERFIISGGNDGKIKIWDFKTGRFVREIFVGSNSNNQGGESRCEQVWKVIARNDRICLVYKADNKTGMDLRTFKPSNEEL